MPEDAPRRIRVLIVDDHKMFADGLARLLTDEDDIEVVAIAPTVADGIAQAVSVAPDVALIDYLLTDGNGVQLAAEIKRQAPAVMIVMLTGSADDNVLLAAIEAGCSGYLTKERAAAEVATAVRLAAAGEALISPRELARLLPRLNRNYRSPGSDLTEREREILMLMSQGMANAAIARQLHLSVNTVRNYVQAILVKLDAHSKLEAVASGVREGIIQYRSPA
jgi:two-component system response regulator DevR